MLFDLVAVCKDCHKAIHKQSTAANDENFEMGLALMAQEWED
jgi:predicted HNH restriction endonuclease